MKGLLIKDFKLLKGQKNFFIIITIMTIAMAALLDDTSFTIGFFSFVMTLFTISTISYDEFDNGYPFLFTLPITRVSYTLEKYVFGLILGIIAWLFSMLCAIAFALLKAYPFLMDILYSGLMIIPFLMMILTIIIPFQLKFGGEKGRIAMIGTFSFLFLIGILFNNFSQIIGINFYSILNTIPVMNIQTTIILLMIFAIFCFTISINASIRMMKKKEF